MTRPTCIEILSDRPDIHEEEPGYQRPGRGGKAEDCIDPNDYRTGA